MERERAREGTGWCGGSGGGDAWLRERSVDAVRERERERKEMGQSGQNLTQPVAPARLA
jgi:hypothetical protein